MMITKLLQPFDSFHLLHFILFPYMLMNNLLIQVQQYDLSYFLSSTVLDGIWTRYLTGSGRMDVHYRYLHLDDGMDEIYGHYYYYNSKMSLRSSIRARRISSAFNLPKAP